MEKGERDDGDKRQGGGGGGGKGNFLRGSRQEPAANRSPEEYIFSSTFVSPPFPLFFQGQGREQSLYSLESGEEEEEEEEDFLPVG